MAISNSDNIVDSRDVIARIRELEQELESFCEDNGIEDSQRGNLNNEKWADWEDSSEAEELKILLNLQEQAESAPNWEYGESLIRDSYFQEYAEDFVRDCDLLPSDLPAWIERNINWKGVVEDLQTDYTPVDWDGVTYWIR